jgi:hypothetical protein
MLRAVASLACAFTLVACGEDDGADAGSGSSSVGTTGSTGSVGTGSTDGGSTSAATGSPCAEPSPSLFCDTMLAFHADARAINEATQTDCRLRNIVASGIGPDGVLLEGVYPAPPVWIVIYVCPGKKIDYVYSATTAEYPAINESIDESLDPEDFAMLGELPDSPAMMDLHAQSNCPGILEIDQSRFVLQPSGIAGSVGVFEIGGTMGDWMSITIDAQGQVVETFPCP